MTGTGIVVTREEGPDGPLVRLLTERGLRVHLWPAIRTAPPSDPAPLAQAVKEMESFEWVVFTSPRAVAAVLDRVAAGRGTRGGDSPVAREKARPRIAAVGEATAAGLREVGWSVDVVPETQTGEALVTALLEAGISAGTRVLFPGSAIARETVPDGLGEAGVVVVRVEAYRTEPAPLDRLVCRAALGAGDIGLVAFTSPSAVRGLEEALGRKLFDRLRSETRAVAIGPTTGEAAERAGFRVDVAQTHSLAGLADRAAGLAARVRIEEA